jgi:PAS domain S-box-containing protein
MPPDENTSSDSLSPPDFHELLCALSDCFLVVSGDGTIVAANRALAEKLSIDSDRLIGSLDRFVEDRAACAEYLGLCSGSRGYLPGVMTFLIDGSRTVFRANGTLMRRGAAPHQSRLLFRLTPQESSVNRFIALNHRIDELSQEIARRKSLEAQIREEREWFKTTLSSIGDAVIATDADGCVTFINPVAEKLTGWQLQEAVAQPLQTVFHILHEHTRVPAENPVVRVLTEGLVVGLANHTILITKNGQEYAIEDSAAPIKNGEGKLIGVVLVFHDVTDRRLTEKELHRSQSTLYERVQELEQFHDAVVGRELKMIELEKEIQQLRNKLPAPTERKDR